MTEVPTKALRVLVTGVTGQVGSYLAELLLAEGHEVLGIARRELPRGVARAKGAWTREGLAAIVEGNGALDAVVHLAAQTNIPESWRDPLGTFETNAALTTSLVYALAEKRPETRLVYASASNIFGRAPRPVQDESTSIAPVSPYGVAKAAGQLAVRGAREGLGARHSSLIYFLAISPRSSPTLVVRKITRGLAAVLRGEAKTLKLGTMEIVRDVCHGADFARAAMLLATRDVPAGEYCCGSGIARSVMDMARVACAVAGLDPARTIEDDPSYARPADVKSLVADPSRLRALGWAPTISFEELVRECLSVD